jgi:hypothetical protein
MTARSAPSSSMSRRAPPGRSALGRAAPGAPADEAVQASMSRAEKACSSVRSAASALSGGRVKRAQRKHKDVDDVVDVDEEPAAEHAAQTKGFGERTNVYKSVIGGSQKYNRKTKEKATLDRQKSATATAEAEEAAAAEEGAGAEDKPALPAGPPKKKAPGGAPGGRAPKFGVRVRACPLGAPRHSACIPSYSCSLEIHTLIHAAWFRPARPAAGRTRCATSQAEGLRRG